MQCSRLVEKSFLRFMIKEPMTVTARPHRPCCARKAQLPRTAVLDAVRAVHVALPIRVAPQFFSGVLRLASGGSQSRIARAFNVDRATI